jgi:hypothetical protein
MSSKGSIGLPWDTKTTGISGAEFWVTHYRLSGLKTYRETGDFSNAMKPQMALTGFSIPVENNSQQPYNAAGDFGDRRTVLATFSYRW